MIDYNKVISSAPKINKIEVSKVIFSTLAELLGPLFEILIEAETKAIEIGLNFNLK